MTKFFPSKGSDKLRALIDKKSALEISYDARIPVASIGQYVRGKSSPTISTALKLASVGIPIEDWVNPGEGKPAKKPAGKKRAAKSAKKSAKKPAKKPEKKPEVPGDHTADQG